MRKFKIGDRVRIVDSSHNTKLSNGSLGTIVEGSYTSRYLTTTVDKESLINVAFDNTSLNGAGVYAHRFELVEPELTDEELAARYREGRKASLADFDELMKRGYTIANGGQIFSQTNVIGPDVEIFKYVTEDVPVIERKQVRKDL